MWRNTDRKFASQIRCQVAASQACPFRFPVLEGAELMSARTFQLEERKNLLFLPGGVLLCFSSLVKDQNSSFFLGFFFSLSAPSPIFLC